MGLHQNLHPARARYGDHGPARASGAHALSRPGARRALGVRHRRRLPARAGRLLAARLRLARAGGPAQRPSPAQGAPARHRPSLPTCARQGAGAIAAPPAPWLAGFGVRVPGDHPAADRSGQLRRRSGRCVHGSRTVIAWLWPVVHTRPEALLCRADGRLRRRVDDRHAGLQALCRAGRRLGLVCGGAPRLCACRQACSASTST